MKYQDFLKAKQSHVKPVGFDVDAREINRRLFDEKQETIADIVAEMLEFAETDSQTIGRDVLRRRIQHFARRIEAAHQHEVAELRECLKEAIRDKCPFTRMSCKHGEPCDYECGTVKWRNALRKEGSEK